MAGITFEYIGKAAMKLPFEEIGATDIKLYDARWWFHYFWQEAKLHMEKDATHRNAVIDALNQVFDAPETNPIKLQTKGPGTVSFLDLINQGKTLKSASDRQLSDQKARLILRSEFAPGTETSHPERWRAVMTTLLKAGFKCVDPANQATPALSTQATDSLANSLLERKFVKSVRGDGPIQLGWRSQGKDLAFVRDKKAIRRQADVDTLCTDMNMSVKWHPFYDEAIKKLLWFRLGQGDNDYFTVISIGNDFKTVTSFPEIDEVRVYGFAALKKSVKEWTPEEAERFKNNLAKVTIAGTTRTEVMLATEVYTFLFALTGLVIDTQTAGQEISGKAFPEKGVEIIPLDNIVGSIPLIRIHHGPRPGDGHTVFPQRLRAAFAHSEDKLVNRLGSSYSQVRQEFSKRRDQAPFTTAWDAAGTKDPVLEYKVGRVLEFPVSADTLKQFKQTLKPKAAAAAVKTSTA